MPVVTKRVDKKVAGNNGWWSNKERHQAAAAYCILGKWALVSATTGVPQDTLRHWAMQDWWAEAVAEIRKSSKIELSGKLSNVVNKTLEVLEDRVVNGDFYYNRASQSFERKPISAQVANKITNDLIDRNQIIEKAAVQEMISEEGLSERLANLKQEMLAFAKAKTLDAVAVEGTKADSTVTYEVSIPIEGETPNA